MFKFAEKVFYKIGEGSIIMLFLVGFKVLPLSFLFFYLGMIVLAYFVLAISYLIAY